jgi:hypothetical protein
MSKRLRLVVRILLAASVLTGLAVAVYLGLAFSALSSGPTAHGYDLLAFAIQALPYLAAVVVLTVAIGSIGARVRFAIGGLALASGVVGGVAVGLALMGLTLAHIDSRNQPPELNSLVLAMYGVGVQMAPAALVLLIGAAILALGTVIARHVFAGPTAAHDASSSVLTA